MKRDVIEYPACGRGELPAHGCTRTIPSAYCDSHSSLNFTLLKIILTAVSLLWCLSLHAMSPDYSSSRKWVEDRCITSTVPNAVRIFVGSTFPKQFANIVYYKKGITLREIVDQTPYKGTNVVVCVLRPGIPASTNIFEIKSSDKTAFVLQPLDVIWIYGSSSSRFTPMW